MLANLLATQLYSAPVNLVTGDPPVLCGTSTSGVPVTSTSATLMMHLLCVKSDRVRGVLNSRLSQLS